MATYNRYPAMDEKNNFPPVVREAMAASKEIEEVSKQHVAPLVAEAIAADNTVSKAAASAVTAEITKRSLVSSNDPNLPKRETVDKLSFAVLDSRGNRTRLETNAIDGGPTEHSLSLDGPALKTYMDFIDGKDARIPAIVPSSSLSFAVVDANGRPTWMQANSSDGGPTNFTVELLQEALSLKEQVPTTYIADGDSITQGGHDGLSPKTWVEVLSSLTGKPFINRGRSGSTGVEAALRQGGLTPVITIDGGILPADKTAVPVTLINITSEDGKMSAEGHGARTYDGTFDGISCQLTKAALGGPDGVWTIKRISTGDKDYKAVEKTPFIIDGLDPSAVRIFWPGRNDYPKTNVLTNIDAMAKWTTDNGGKFLVLSILTRSGIGDTDPDNVEVNAVNDTMQKKYPRNYVNIRGWLIRSGLEAINLTPTSADLTAIAKGGIPPSLMHDSLHPNANGRTAIAIYLHQQLVARNWV